MPKPVPAFGLAYTVPENALSAWGARLIVTQDGTVDFVHDRQGSDEGPLSRRLLDTLSERYPLDRLQDEVRLLLIDGDMNTRSKMDFTLFSDGELEVHADTNGSAGYCYVTAWLNPPADAEDQEAHGIYDPRRKRMPE